MWTGFLVCVFSFAKTPVITDDRWQLFDGWHSAAVGLVVTKGVWPPVVGNEGPEYKKGKARLSPAYPQHVRRSLPTSRTLSPCTNSLNLPHTPPPPAPPLKLPAMAQLSFTPIPPKQRSRDART